jgi:hypothetical protein
MYKYRVKNKKIIKFNKTAKTKTKTIINMHKKLMELMELHHLYQKISKNKKSKII